VSDTLLDAVLEPGGLSVVFQPIFDVSQGGRRLHALECLIRGPKGTNLESPEILFEYARRKRAEAEVDRACVAAALRVAGELPGSPDLSINVHATTLGRDHEFLVFLGDTAESHGIDLDRVTVEIVEHAFPWDGPRFQSALAALRAIGVRIALDDVGRGQSNYRMILDCRPDYFKLDRYFIHGCRGDFYRQAVIESVADLAAKFGARVVAEAVETEGDFDTVTGLGIDLVQGYLLAKAMPASKVVAGGFLQPVEPGLADRPGGDAG
jgi:EAL domain-containing protein (putative c-di-GMP-specific phosphodiesterase class I)